MIYSYYENYLQFPFRINNLDNLYRQEKIKNLYYSDSKLDFKGSFGKDLDSLEKEYLVYFRLK